MGYAHHTFVLIMRTEGTMEASPRPAEKTGDFRKVPNIQNTAAMGIAATYSRNTALHT